MSVYEEYCVKMKPKFGQLLLRNLLIVLGIIFVILAPTLYYTLVFGFTCFVLAYYYNNHLKQEYEYIIYDDDFAIDAIINKNKRKKKARLNLQYLKVFTDQKDVVAQYTKEKLKGRRVIRRNMRNPQEKPYLLVVEEPDMTQVFIINVNPQMANAFLTRFPARTFLSQSALDEIHELDSYDPSSLWQVS